MSFSEKNLKNRLQPGALTLFKNKKAVKHPPKPQIGSFHKAETPLRRHFSMITRLSIRLL